jgi:hypothetical protein
LPEAPAFFGLDHAKAAENGSKTTLKGLYLKTSPLELGF